MPSPLTRIRKLLKDPAGAAQALELLHTVGTDAIYDSLLKSVLIEPGWWRLKVRSGFPKNDRITVLRLISMATGTRAQILRDALFQLRIANERDLALGFVAGLELRRLELQGCPRPLQLDRLGPLELLSVQLGDIDLSALTGPIRSLRLDRVALQNCTTAQLRRLQIRDLEIASPTPLPAGALRGWRAGCLSFDLDQNPQLPHEVDHADDLAISGVSDWAQLGGLQPRCLRLAGSSVRDLSGVPESVEELRIAGNEALEDISALTRLPRLRILHLSRCPAIRSLAPIIERRPRLDDFGGFGFGGPIPEPASPLLDPRADHRYEACSDDESGSIARQLLDDPDPDVARRAADTLYLAGAHEALAASESRAAWEALATLPIARSEAMLRRALAAPATRLSALAWCALRPLRPPACAPPPALIASLEDSGPLAERVRAPLTPLPPLPPLPVVEVDPAGRRSFPSTRPPDLADESPQDITDLRIGNKTSGGYSTWSDAHRFPAMPKLVQLDLRSRLLTRLDAMGHLVSLRSLQVDANKKLCSLTGIEPLHQLIQLYVGHTSVEDLTPLKGLGLRRLTLHHTRVKDLTPLADVPHLAVLTLGKTRVKDLQPLSGLPLRSLSCPEMPNLTDLGPLAGMQTLQTLTLSECPRLHDFSALRTLPRLERLDLSRLAFADVEMLFGLPELRWLSLHRTELEHHPLVPELAALLTARGGQLSFDYRLPQSRAER